MNMLQSLFGLVLENERIGCVGWQPLRWQRLCWLAAAGLVGSCFFCWQPMRWISSPWVRWQPLGWLAAAGFIGGCSVCGQTLRWLAAAGLVGSCWVGWQLLGWVAATALDSQLPGGLAAAGFIGRCSVCWRSLRWLAAAVLVGSRCMDRLADLSFGCMPLSAAVVVAAFFNGSIAIPNHHRRHFCH